MTDTKHWQRGDKVICNGYIGAVLDEYIRPNGDSGMYEVRLPGGDVCVSGSSLTEHKPMTLEDIKGAIEAGKKVYWSHTGYEVIKTTCGDYSIVCLSNDSAIGLTWRDGKTLNGKPDEFFTTE